MRSKKTLVVCSDPGGANCLAAYIKQKKIKFVAKLDNNAKKIFKNYFGKSLKTTSLIKGIQNANHVITATSWKSNLEKRAIKLGRDKKIRTTTLLEHWVNYKERFILNGKVELPDILIVQDKYAEKLAYKYFKGVKIIRVPNYYLKNNLNKMKNQKQSKKINFLYLSEPIETHYKKGNLFQKKRDYNEFDSFKFFLKNINLISKNIDRITLRLHPSEKKNKYNLMLKKIDFLPIQISYKKPLIEDICNSSIVFGCETMAMILALMAKKRVICTIPSKSKLNTSLPYKSIEYMRDLIN